MTIIYRLNIFSCLACVGNYPLLISLPETPAIEQMRLWFEKACCIPPSVTSMLTNSVAFHFPATKPVLPKLLTLLKYCHESGETSNKWYYCLQEIIQNHYKAQGTCFFFDGSKEILYGEGDKHGEEMSDVIHKLKMLIL